VEFDWPGAVYAGRPNPAAAPPFTFNSLPGTLLTEMGAIEEFMDLAARLTVEEWRRVYGSEGWRRDG
jgi:hypothetical protein